MEIKEISVNVPSFITLSNVVPSVEGYNDNTEQHLNEEPSHQVTNSHMTDANEPQEIVVRKSQRERRSTILNDYVVYLQESDFYIRINEDPVSYSQAINSVESNKWIDAMKDELKSIKQNNIWDLVKLPENCKRVGCK